MGWCLAYYENEQVFFGGNLRLYQRNLSVAVPNAGKHRPRNWYMKIKLPGGKTIDRSTKLAVYEDAYEFAKSEMLRLQNAARLGHSLQDYTFHQHWEDWYSRHLKRQTWSPDRAKWHKQYAARYFKPFFTDRDGVSINLNDIGQDLADAYWDWRIAYWSSDDGERRKAKNPTRKGAKSKGTHNSKAVPALKTLQMEASALNQIFEDARKWGRLQKAFKFKPTLKRLKDARRSHFPLEEYRVMSRYLRSYRDGVGIFKDDRVNAWHQLMRKQLYYLVFFLSNTGMRIGEARHVKWSDVRFDQDLQQSDDKICEIRIGLKGKTKQQRYVQSQSSLNSLLKEWKKISPFTKPDDLIWFGQSKTGGESDQVPMRDVTGSFQKFLERVPYNGREHGLLYDDDGARRVLYSLRHTYATFRLTEGNVSIQDLALNMGCKVAQIENHYSHVLSAQRRDQITQTRPRARSVERADTGTADGVVADPTGQATSSADEGIVAGMGLGAESAADSALMLRIVEQFQAGKIDQATFLALVGPKAESA